MKVKEMTYVAGHQVVRPATNCCGQEFVVIGIVRHLHARQIKYKVRNLPENERDIENAIA